MKLTPENPGNDHEVSALQQSAYKPLSFDILEGAMKARRIVPPPSVHLAGVLATLFFAGAVLL